jgi:phage terminase large subunit-like protein
MSTHGLTAPPKRLTANSYRTWPPTRQRAFLASLTPKEKAALFYDWRFWSRPNQIAPAGDWRVWLILAGRGFGKTRAGAEWVRWKVETSQCSRIALVAETAADARDVMIEGESGILAISPPWNRPKYEPTKCRLTWPSGAIASTYSGDSPDQLRGPQHDGAWADEPAKWTYGADAWSNLEFGLRLGANPQAVATTTPRAIPFIKDLLSDPQTVTTRGSTYENKANLPRSFVRRVLTKYEGTRLGRQEIGGEVLDDTPGALWTRSCIEATRLRSAPALTRIVIGVDPSAGGIDGETGIVGAGKDANEHGYILGDYTESGDPALWAVAVIRAYIELQADAIVVETNNGGKMIAHVIRQTSVEIGGIIIMGRNLPIIEVWASRGKHTRAEPISMLWSQGRGHYVGAFPELEDQCCTWVPGEDSPDRMDAKVWALTELFPNEEAAGEDFAPVVGGTRRMDSQLTRRLR